MTEGSFEQIVSAHRRLIQKLELQIAQQGIYTPAAIRNELEDAYRNLGKLMIRDIVVKERQPPRSRFRGLILLVGPGQAGRDPLDQSALASIKFHTKKLEYCWMIGSSGKGGSTWVIERLQLECDHLDIKTDAHYVDDPFTVQPTYKLVEWLYTDEIPKAGITEQEVIADITGATKPMSFGMLRACGTRRPMQYMAKQDNGISTPVMLEYGFAEE